MQGSKGEGEGKGQVKVIGGRRTWWGEKREGERQKGKMNEEEGEKDERGRKRKGEVILRLLPPPVSGRARCGLASAWLRLPLF